MEYESINQSMINRFVVPFKIDQIDLRNQNISIALVGSRGSGKSTFIQYFSHSTRFDLHLDSVDKSELDCIVLYWKPDIAYCQGLNESWLGKEISERFFMNHASLEIMDEFIKMVLNVKHHFPSELSKLDSSDCKLLDAFRKITNREVKDIDSLSDWIDEQKFELSSRLNPLCIEGMLGLNPKDTLVYLIKCLEKDCPIFSDTHFKVFVDEFELLEQDQQRIINGYRKGSSAKLNWNVAYKLYSKVSIDTKSNQPLQEPDDYKIEVLDDLISKDFSLYASEIFLLSVQSSGVDCSNIGIDPEILGDREKISIRKGDEYRSKIIGAMKKLLPKPDKSQLSSEGFLNQSWLKRKVENIVKAENKDSSLVNEIMKNPSLAVTIVGTSKQKRFDLDSLLINSPSTREKINTYQLNSLLSFRNQNSQLNLPIYSGFDRFIAMTTPNVRHFKVLCFNSLKQLGEEDKDKVLSCFDEMPNISPNKMDNAAVSTAKNLFEEIISYPPYGNKLYMLANRIGELFKASQKSQYQTEPERVIFSIKYDYANSDPDLENLLSAGEAWRVFISDDSKRLKSDSQYTSKEYVLNPIYSAKFGISYRKNRGIVFDLEEFKKISDGTSEEFETIRNRYRKKWKCDLDDNIDDGQIKEQGEML
jgi:hypothetical protein